MSYPDLGRNILNIPIHFVFSLNCNDIENREDGIYYEQSLYINGELFESGGLSQEHWNYAVKNALKNCNYFDIGVMSGGAGTGFRHTLSKMDVYALRLYNKGLNSEEIKNNYDKVVAYHNTIE